LTALRNGMLNLPWAARRFSFLERCPSDDSFNVTYHKSVPLIPSATIKRAFQGTI
jgi:hypothetical protein